MTFPRGAKGDTFLAQRLREGWAIFELGAAAALLGAFERFEQEEDFGGHGVVQFGGVGEAAVAATGDDGLEGLDECAKVARQVGAYGHFCER